MQPPFTTYAASRFINRDAVVTALRQAADEAAQRCPGVEAIFLFGSFVHGTPTPRSDADLLIAIRDAADRDRVHECCFDIFLRAPVPVELFVQTWSEIEASRREGRGLAATALRDAVRLV